uniref:Reverse transcriptase domain-containing protein n=1 Tax=Triticum urartu TaxID=4572 RepID=A0A8R7V7I7_TRIUA
MEVRGFHAWWCDWMGPIFRSSMSAVLLNGVPGHWISCKKGLHQGDSISPYLFLLVADVLQRMIKLDGGMAHPLVAGAPPLVLQYANDTLIVLKAELSAVRRLKHIVDDFAAATGLLINF